jgi:Alpha/beta hydrolase family
VTGQVLLVPGAWHGAWAWDRVVALLRSAAVPVMALGLPRTGRTPAPAGDLYSDASLITQALNRATGGVVLVGHSYAGAVITEAGGHPAVEHLVYVAGFPLDLDESCGRAAPSESAAFSHAGRPDLGAGLQVSDDGTATVAAATAAACFYSDCDAPTTQWALDRIGPHPMAALGQSPTRTAWRTKPSTYVVCAEDQAVHPELQRALARRCTSSVQWPTGHSPFLSQPAMVADLLAGLAGLASS